MQKTAYNLLTSKLMGWQASKELSWLISHHLLSRKLLLITEQIKLWFKEIFHDEKMDDSEKQLKANEENKKIDETLDSTIKNNDLIQLILKTIEKYQGRNKN